MKTGIDQFIEIANNRENDIEIKKYFLRDLVSGKILDAMHEKDISKSKLATMMGCSKAHISRLLDGDRNMTLDTLAHLLHILNYDISIDLSDKTERTIFYNALPGMFIDIHPSATDLPNTDSIYSDCSHGDYFLLSGDNHSRTNSGAA